MISPYQMTYWTDPLSIRGEVERSEDGRGALAFKDAKEARSWIMRFSRATERERASAEKRMDLDGRTYALNFYATRSDNRVTVNYLPKTCPIVKVEIAEAAE